MVKMTWRRFYAAYFSQLATQMVYFSFALVDSLMVSAVDTRMMAGVGQGAILVNVVQAFFSGFIYAYVNLYNQGLASKDPWPDGRFSSLCVQFSILVAPAGILIVALGGLLFSMLGNSTLTANYASQFSLTLSFGLPLSLISGAYLSQLRSHSRDRDAVLVVCLSSLVNALLNWIVLTVWFRGILPPHVGVAISTICTQIFMLLLLRKILNVRNGPVFSNLWSNWRENLTVHWQAWRYGVGIAINNLNDWVMSLILVLFVAHFGEAAVVANQTADSFSSTLYRFVQAGCGTIGIFFAQYWGAVQVGTLSHYDYQKRAMQAILYSFLPVAGASIAAYFFRVEILMLFHIDLNQPEFKIALLLFDIHLMLIIFYFVGQIFGSLLEATLQTRLACIASSVISYLLILPAAFAAKQYELGVQYIWIAEGLGLMALSTVYVVLFRKYHRSPNRGEHVLQS